MTLKTFYKNFEKQNFIAKKLFSNIIYSKHLVRSDQEFDNSIQILDNFSNFFYATNNLKLGFSLFTTKVIFKHKYDDRVRFNHFLNYSILGIKNSRTASRLYYALRGLNTNSKVCLMLLLHPVRGGFKAYTCGFLGFLPRSQAKVLYKRIWLINNLKKKSFLSGSFFFLAKNHIFKFFFPSNVLLKYVKIAIYTCFKIYNFVSKLANSRRRFFDTNLNFVFLIKKSEDRNYGKIEALKAMKKEILSLEKSKHRDSKKIKFFKAIKKKILTYENSAFKKEFKLPHSKNTLSK